MKAVDLFSGCGGLSLGFQNAGFDVLAAFDWWQSAVQCYKTNFSHPVFRRDLSDTAAAIAEIKKLNPDVIIGSQPCQDFSSAGKRVENDRAKLTVCYAKIVAGVRPAAFCMENVDRAKNSNAYMEARSIFHDCGYGLTEAVLDASLCGVPQKRKRFFCVGMLNKTDGFALDAILSRLAKEPMTVRDYFGDSMGFEHYYRPPRNYNRRAIFSVDEPAPTMRGVNRPIPKGYKGNANDSVPVSDSVHALTTKDRALIQTFPTDFKWVGSKTDVEQMIGNAVPVNLAKFVGEILKSFLEAN